MDYIIALMFGLIQSITELLPVSSIGHLVLAREVMPLSEANTLALAGVMHVTTTLAVLTYFRGEVWVLLQALIRKLSRLPTNQKDLTLLYALVLGTIPVIIVGLLLEETMSEYLKTPPVVVSMLFLGAAFFMYAEWRYYLKPPQGSLTLNRGLAIGLFQLLALLPGLSRLGSALVGGMLFGLSRYEATRFSFFLAIPITLGLGAKNLLDLMSVPGEVAWLPILFASIVGYIIGILTIRFFLAFIRYYTLWPFIWYNIILACLVGYVALLV